MFLNVQSVHTGTCTLCQSEIKDGHHHMI